MLFDSNFLNRPAIRFKKPKNETLEEFRAKIYKIFITDENSGQKWKDDCYDALASGNKDEIERLKKEGGNFDIICDSIDILIDNFTRDDNNTDFSFEFYKNMILKDKFFKNIEFKTKPFKQIVFDTQKGVFKVTQLSNLFAVFKERFPQIESKLRHRNCHSDSICAALMLEDKCKVATAYNYTFGEGQKFLHTWVEAGIGKQNTKYCIDLTRNILVKKEFYYMIRNIKGPVYKISNQTLAKEVDVYCKLHSVDPWLLKVYLTNRPVAKRIYNQLQTPEENIKTINQMQ